MNRPTLPHYALRYVEDELAPAFRFVALLAPVAVGISLAATVGVELWGATW